MRTKLYVGNLPYETTETDLQTLFQQTGQVASVNVMRDRATGQARGFAFVEMSSSDEANAAINQLDQKPFGGRNLTVNLAKPMTSRSGGGGEYGGGQRRSEPRW
jgi:RNA recognition motif-containing protein